MSEMPLRRRTPVNRRTRPPHPSPSTHKIHRKIAIHRSSNLKKNSKFIKRCNSEPTLLTSGMSIAGVGDDHRHMTPPEDCASIFRARTSTNLFSSSPELLPNSPEKSKGYMYNKDAKVVVKVMVEGSPGPVRAMVKLGSSVEETIRVVMNKYNAEGRNPQINQDAISSFELHHSYFSLKRLDKSDMIGEIGSRSFYMRKSVNDHEDMCSNASADSEIVEASTNDSPPSSSNIFLRGFVCQEFKKIITVANKIWRFLGCFNG